LLDIAVLAVDETQLVMADRDDVAVLHRMLLDQLAVDVGAIGAVQVLQEGVIQDIDDERVVTAHSRIVDTDIVSGRRLWCSALCSCCIPRGYCHPS